MLAETNKGSLEQCSITRNLFRLQKRRALYLYFVFAGFSTARIWPMFFITRVTALMNHSL
jgi:hypothetical protein